MQSREGCQDAQDLTGKPSRTEHSPRHHSCLPEGLRICQGPVADAHSGKAAGAGRKEGGKRLECLGQCWQGRVEWWRLGQWPGNLANVPNGGAGGLRYEGPGRGWGCVAMRTLPCKRQCRMCPARGGLPGRQVGAETQPPLSCQVCFRALGCVHSEGHLFLSPQRCPPPRGI